jgi:DNA helicase HerA-like ATPase
MSQIHNFFIHRLVNDRDLLLLEHSISTLDYLSRSMIPNLSKGCAVITGTSFDIPMVVQFKPLAKDCQPDSGDVDLKELWKDSSSENFY